MLHDRCPRAKVPDRLVCVLQTEKAIRRDYDPQKKTWRRTAVVLRLEKAPFSTVRAFQNLPMYPCTTAATLVHERLTSALAVNRGR